MAVHKLFIDDFEECDSYALIAIHCALEDYRLAYLLNNRFNLKLKRKQYDLDFSEAKYSIFEWEDKNQLNTWNLVSNICKIEKSHNNDISSLFNNDSNIVTTYNLVPEFKTVNFLLKISYQTSFFKEKMIVNSLLSVPQIVTAYSLQTKNQQTKTNLIFN